MTNTAVARGKLTLGAAPKLEGVQVIWRQKPSWDSVMHYGSYAFSANGLPTITRIGGGLIIGLTGAGGQLVLFQALTIGPAYLIFPIVALSPAITVHMAVALLREHLLGLTKARSSSTPSAPSSW